MKSRNWHNDSIRGNNDFWHSAMVPKITGDSCWRNIHGTMNLIPTSILHLQLSFLQQTLQMMNCVKQRNFYVKLFETCQGRVTSANNLITTRPNFWFFNSFRHEFLDLCFLACTNSVTIFSVTNQGHYEAALSSSPLYCPHHEPSPGPGVQ